MKALAAIILAAVVAVTAATTHAAVNRQAAIQPGVAPLTYAQAHAVRAAGEWHPGCPVELGQLRVLTVRYYGFDHQTHLGQIVVNAQVTPALTTVFRKLFRMRFPIRDIAFSSAYGPHAWASGDVTASFECRQAVPSPCDGNSTGVHWSMHAYGEAVDINPRENPYVGCGMTRDKTAVSYMNRKNQRPGMNERILPVFQSVGWGWGGSWVGSTHDYMHFSINGH